MISKHSNALTELRRYVETNLSRPRLDAILNPLDEFLRFEDQSIMLTDEEREQLDETIKKALKNTLQELLGRIIEDAIEHASKCYPA